MHETLPGVKVKRFASQVHKLRYLSVYLLGQINNLFCRGQTAPTLSNITRPSPQSCACISGFLSLHTYSIMISGPLLVFLLLCGTEFSHAGRVLVMPGEFSHWHNMRNIIDALVERNHSVTVLTSSSSPSVPHMKKEKFTFNVFKVNMEKEQAKAVWDSFINLWMNNTAPKYEKVFMFWRMMTDFTAVASDTCYGMFHNPDLLRTLRESHYDVLLSDPMMACTDLMAQTLNIPHVLSLRFTFAYGFERMCGQLPTTPSYVPAAGVTDHLTDNMNFMERLENMLLYILYTAIFKLNTRINFDPLYTEINGNSCIFYSP